MSALDSGVRVTDTEHDDIATIEAARRG